MYALALLLIFSLSLIVYWPQISKNFETEKQQYLKLGTSAALVALIFRFILLLMEHLSRFIGLLLCTIKNITLGIAWLRMDLS